MGEIASIANDFQVQGSEAKQDLPLFKRIAVEKRAIRENAIPREWRLAEGLVTEGQLNVIDIPTSCGILTENECIITELKAIELVEKLQSRELSSYEVTLAFCKRAAIAHQLVSSPIPMAGSQSILTRLGQLSFRNIL